MLLCCVFFFFPVHRDRILRVAYNYSDVFFSSPISSDIGSNFICQDTAFQWIHPSKVPNWRQGYSRYATSLNLVLVLDTKSCPCAIFRSGRKYYGDTIDRTEIMIGNKIALLTSSFFFLCISVQGAKKKRQPN